MIGGYGVMEGHLLIFCLNVSESGDTVAGAYLILWCWDLEQRSPVRSDEMCIRDRVNRGQIYMGLNVKQRFHKLFMGIRDPH